MLVEGLAKRPLRVLVVFHQEEIEENFFSEAKKELEKEGILADLKPFCYHPDTEQFLWNALIRERYDVVFVSESVLYLMHSDLNKMAEQAPWTIIYKLPVAVHPLWLVGHIKNEAAFPDAKIA